MRITKLDGFQAWINPHRVNSITECNVGEEERKGTRIETPNYTFVTLDSFESLAEKLDSERKNK